MKERVSDTPSSSTQVRHEDLRPIEGPAAAPRVEEIGPRGADPEGRPRATAGDPGSDAPGERCAGVSRPDLLPRPSAARLFAGVSALALRFVGAGALPPEFGEAPDSPKRRDGEPPAPRDLPPSPPGFGPDLVRFGPGIRMTPFDDPNVPVWIHTGPRADAIARRHGAAAFAFGDHVGFRAGAYRGPRSALLHHELVHVQQQRMGDRRPDETQERDADLGRMPQERLGPAWAHLQLQEIDSDAFPYAAVFDHDYCRYLYSRHTRGRGPDDMPPGEIVQLVVEYCIPHTNLHGEGPILSEEDHQPRILVQRYAKIELDSGAEIEFLLRGFHNPDGDFEVPDDIASLDAILEGAGTGHFELDIVLTAGTMSTHTTLVGPFAFLQAQGSASDVPGLHPLLRAVGAGEWAEVDISLADHYRFIVSRILADSPWFNRAMVPTHTPPIHETFPSEEQARQRMDAVGTAGAMVTREGEAYHVWLLHPMDLFWVSERARGGSGLTRRYAFLDEEFVALRARDRGYDQLRGFRDAYYNDPDAARRGRRGAAECLVYHTGDGFYGRYALAHADALTFWGRFDAMSLADLTAYEVRHWRGPNRTLGRFESLYVRGQSELHAVDLGYYRGRDTFRDQADRMERIDGIRVDGRDYSPVPYLVLAHDGHEDTRRYIWGELDRPVESGGTLRAELADRPRLAGRIARYAAERVWNVARREALGLVDELLQVIDTLGSSEDTLRQLVFGFSRLNAETQGLIVSALGVPEEEQANVLAVLRDTASALDVHRGLEVHGVSIATLTRSVARTRIQAQDLRRQIADGTVDAHAIDGEFGNTVRDRTYEHLGFRRLRGDQYPHQDVVGLMPTALDGDPLQSANLLEQLYGNYVAAQDTATRIVIITAIAAVTALLMLVSMGFAALLAGAVAEAGTTAFVVWEVLFGATIFTGLSEGMAQMMGGGALNTEDADFGIGDLTLSWALNVATFGVFRGLGTVLEGVSLATRLSATYGAFLALSVAGHRLVHGEMPHGTEWVFLVYETTVMFMMLEVGGYFARPAIQRMAITGASVRAIRLQGRLNTIRANADAARIAYNEVFTNASAGRTEKIMLTRRYLEVLRDQRDLLQELDTARDIETNVDVTRELAAVREHLQGLEQAFFLLQTGAQSVGGQARTLSYLPGASSVAAIEGRFGAANVTGPDTDGVIVVQSGAERILFLPQRANAGSGARYSALLGRPGIRELTPGIVAVEPRALDGIRQEIVDQGGSTRALHDGSFAVEAGGESWILVGEGQLRLVPQAEEAAVEHPGSGRLFILQGLRSEAARDGFRDLLRTEWADHRELVMLDALSRMETTAIREGRSLNDVLEQRGHTRRVAEGEDAIATPDASRAAIIDAADALLRNLYEQLTFVEGLEGAGMPTGRTARQIGARMAEVRGIRADHVLHEGQLVGSPQTRTYQPGPEAVEILRQRHGADNVTGPSPEGVITVDLPTGVVEYLPVPEGADPRAVLDLLSARGRLRMVGPGVAAAEPVDFRSMRGLTQGRGGEWIEGTAHIAIVRFGGAEVILLSEALFRFVPVAEAAEAAAAGTGLDTLRQGLQSDLAREGLDAWVAANRGGRGDVEVLEGLRDLEENALSARRGSRSLNALFEGQALAAIEAANRVDLLAQLRRIGWGTDPWVQRMIVGRNAGELTGVLAEIRVRMMRTAEVAADPALSGRNIEIIDKVWILAELPEASRADWLAAHPRPERANFPDQAAFDVADRAWLGEAASVKDLPGGGAGSQLKDVDHVLLQPEASGQRTVIETIETKYAEGVRGAQGQAEGARDMLVEAIQTGQVDGSPAVVTRAEGDVPVDRLTNLRIGDTPDAVVRTPDLDVRQLANDIVADPTLIDP